MVIMAARVKRKAEMKAGLSPKFNMPIARAPMTTPRLSHDRKVRSFAKKTLGSTRVGRAIRLPGRKREEVVSLGRTLEWGNLEMMCYADNWMFI
jgi:hypothetical protein